MDAPWQSEGRFAWPSALDGIPDACPVSDAAGGY